MMPPFVARHRALRAGGALGMAALAVALAVAAARLPCMVHLAEGVAVLVGYRVCHGAVMTWYPAVVVSVSETHVQAQYGETRRPPDSKPRAEHTGLIPHADIPTRLRVRRATGGTAAPSRDACSLPYEDALAAEDVRSHRLPASAAARAVAHARACARAVDLAGVLYDLPSARSARSTAPCAACATS